LEEEAVPEIMGLIRLYVGVRHLGEGGERGRSEREGREGGGGREGREGRVVIAARTGESKRR